MYDFGNCLFYTTRLKKSKKRKENDRNQIEHRRTTEPTLDMNSRQNVWMPMYSKRARLLRPSPLLLNQLRIHIVQQHLSTPTTTSIPDTNANKKACLIGINYTGTPNRLYGCENDVRKIHHVLTHKCGYEARNITVITEQTTIKPTRRNILLQFVRLLIESKPGDQLFFGFSGHGYFVPDMDGDEEDGKDEIIITCENHYIVDDEFRALIHKYMKPDVQLFGFFDNCHSGTILDLRYEYDIPLKTVPFTTIDDINIGRSSREASTVPVQTNEQYVETPGQVILLSGCRDEEKSVDAMINGRFNGVLTCTFMEIILNFPERLTWYDAVQEMEFYIRKLGFEQRPLLSTGRPIDLYSPVQF